jgi:hypothetical protein
MRGQNQHRERDEAEQIYYAAGLEVINTKIGPILDDIAVAVTGAQTKQNKNAAGHRQKGVNAQQQQYEMIMKILLGHSHMIAIIVPFLIEDSA